MIRIRVTDLPARGLTVQEVLPLEGLNARMDEAAGNDIHFVAAPAFSITMKPEIAGAELKGTILARYEQPCGVCLQIIERELTEELAITLKTKSFRPGIDRPTSKSEWEDGVGIIYFDGEQIDLEEILQESLILSVDPFDSSHPNCPGLPKSASEPNDEKKQTLGDLIKDALQ